MLVLRKLAEWILVPVLLDLIEKATAALKKRMELAREKRQIEEKNRSAREQTEQANTPEEREDAAKRIGQNF